MPDNPVANPKPDTVGKMSGQHAIGYGHVFTGTNLSAKCFRIASQSQGVIAGIDQTIADTDS